MAVQTKDQPTKTTQQLIDLLHQAFDYTTDNNRDLISDPTFPMADVEEELRVYDSYSFLLAYIARNTDMVNHNLDEDLY